MRCGVKGVGRFGGALSLFLVRLGARSRPFVLASSLLDALLPLPERSVWVRLASGVWSLRPCGHGCRSLAPLIIEGLAALIALL